MHGSTAAAIVLLFAGFLFVHVQDLQPEAPVTCDHGARRLMAARGKLGGPHRPIRGARTSDARRAIRPRWPELWWSVMSGMAVSHDPPPPAGTPPGTCTASYAIWLRILIPPLTAPVLLP